MRKIDETKCIENVYSRVGNWGQFQQCSRKRGHGPNGAYCKTHDPAAVKARDEARQAKFNAEMAAREEKFTAQTLGHLMIEAGYDTEVKVRALLDRVNDTRYR